MANVIIRAEALEKQYMKHKVLKQASFAIREGMICGLIGPNGAGKTTIMKILGGLVFPTGGEISIYGGRSEKELAKARDRMSFMIETPYANQALSARENLEKQRLQKGIPDAGRVDEVLQLVGLSEVGKKPVSKFSLGMKQRLGIAISLLSKPEIMVLDEPVNGLDPEGIVEIRELLLRLNQEEHITILISSHILSELALLCTDYIFIQDGQIRQQVSQDELQRLCKKYYHIHTNQDAVALTVLEQELGIRDYDVEEDGSIRVYEKLDCQEQISRTLYAHDVVPVELHICEANLEQYYMHMEGEKDGEHNQGNMVSA